MSPLVQLKELNLKILYLEIKIRIIKICYKDISFNVQRQREIITNHSVNNNKYKNFRILYKIRKNHYKKKIIKYYF